MRITVMGLGLHGGGLAAATFLADAGADVTITDMRDAAVLAPSIEALGQRRIRYVLGRHETADFSGADIVIKNPAVKPDSPYLAAARAVETDISLFLRLARSPIVAVTGSKGKSSTASAIHHGFTESGIHSLLGGNITVSPLTFLDSTGPDRPVVLELSSWQLADMRGMGVLKPKVAVLTAIMPDHMNYYSSMDAYVADKRLIYVDQDAEDFTVCDRGEDWGRSFGSETRARVVWYGGEDDGSAGSWLEPGGIPGRRRGFHRAPSAAPGSPGVEILGEELSVMGPHQRRNLLAAGTALMLMGLDAAKVRAAMATFPGVEHRLELFAVRDGVRWYNDSAATIPEAAAAALGAFEGRTILISGGTDKNLDFRPVRKAYAKAAAIILLAGTGTDKLVPLLDEDGVPYEGPYSSLDETIRRAAALARPGDSVVFSPGCTSFGMFLHEFDRGMKFKAAARGILDGQDQATAQ